MNVTTESAQTPTPATVESNPADLGPREIMTGPLDTETGEETAEKVAESKAPKTEKAVENEESSGEKQQRPNKLQDRIDELTKARRESEREAAYWKARAATQDEAPKAQGPPVRADFANEEDFIDAKVEFKLEQKLAQRDTQNAVTRQVETQATQWAAKLTEAKAAVADFDAVMNAAELPVEQHILELIQEHDQGALIAYHLAKNPGDLEALNKMSPAKAAFRLGKLGDQAEAAVSKPTKATISKISSAPPPAKVAAAGSNLTPAPQDMSMDEYREFRRKQGARWA
jgi:hypothetical protein